MTLTHQKHGNSRVVQNPLCYRSQKHIANGSHAARAHGNLVCMHFIGGLNDLVCYDAVSSYRLTKLQTLFHSTLCRFGQYGVLLTLLLIFNVLNRCRRVVPVKHRFRADANECGIQIQR